MGDPAHNKTVVLRFLEALCRGDRDAARQAFAADASWHYPPSLGGPGVHRGRDAIFDVYFAVDERLYETGTRRYDLQVTNAIAEGDSVAVEMRHRGQTRDGRPYETDYHVLYQLEGGRIQRVREYFDSLYVRRLYSDEELGVRES
jgi:ketosteroid isomerase-like protein